MKSILFLVGIVLIFVGCKTPESTSKNYAEFTKNGDCESLILISTGSALTTAINAECSPYESIVVSDVDCEIGKSSATCVYIEQRTYYSLNTDIKTTLKLVKLDHDWKVANSSSEISRMTGGNDPEIVTDLFIKLITEANFNIAKMLTVQDAKHKINRLIEEEKAPLHTEILSKTVEISENTAICKTVEKRDDNKEIKFIYELIKIGEEWKISKFYVDINGSPIATTETFVLALSSGNCSEALDLATGNAKETVKGTIDSGCEAYKTEIINTTCEIEDETATCVCTEKRDILGELTFNYTLVKVNDEWKVSEYSKDLDYNE